MGKNAKFYVTKNFNLVETSQKDEERDFVIYEK